MTSQATLQREIEEIKQRILPPKDIVIIFCFGRDDEPHGKYGHRGLHVFTGEVEPIEEAEEIELLRESYAEAPKHWKKKGHKWNTFEKFMKSRECKCGREHPYRGSSNG